MAGLRIDGGIPGQLARVPNVARALEREGYDGCWTGEINHDPFLPMLLAAEHPMFVPEPQSYGFPKVFIAAVGEAMTEMCGEVADGVLAHAFTTRRYLDEVTTPALLHGMRRSARSRSDFQVACPVFVVTGDSEAEWEAAANATRKQIAFYGSTPAYRKVLKLHGWEELHSELYRLSLHDEWETMGSLIDDDVLEAFAVVAPPAELAGGLRSRCDGVVDRVMPAFPRAVSQATISAVLHQLR